MNSPDAAALTVDAFWRGAFAIAQPAQGGYRSGLDALLVAACVGPQWQGAALDMGAGAGAIGIAAASRAPGLRVVLAESSPEMAACAQASLALSANDAVADRLSLAIADLTAARPLREAAGLADGSFDRVLSNPPFYPAGHRPSPDPLRRQALSVPDAGFLPRWLQVAAALTRHGGHIVLITPPEQLAVILPAMQGRFGDLALLPVHTRVHARASRILVAGRRGSKAPLRLLPGLALAGADGAPTQEEQWLEEGRLHLDLEKSDDTYAKRL